MSTFIFERYICSKNAFPTHLVKTALKVIVSLQTAYNDCAEVVTSQIVEKTAKYLNQVYGVVIFAFTTTFCFSSNSIHFNASKYAINWSNNTITSSLDPQTYTAKRFVSEKAPSFYLATVCRLDASFAFSVDTLAIYLKTSRQKFGKAN